MYNSYELWCYKDFDQMEAEKKLKLIIWDCCKVIISVAKTHMGIWIKIL